MWLQETWSEPLVPRMVTATTPTGREDAAPVEAEPVDTADPVVRVGGGPNDTVVKRCAELLGGFQIRHVVE